MMMITDGSRKLLRPLYPSNPHWKLHPDPAPKYICHDYGGGTRVMRRSSSSSPRWNPTAEQVQALEEMYGRGIRSPSPEQIQQIAAKLRNFGKIEGKNVFYWFQNHKARDNRNKNPRQQHIPTLSGLSKRSRLEIEHPKKLPTLSNCSTGTASKCPESAVDQELQKKYYIDDVKVKGRGPEKAYPVVALNFWKMLGTKNDNFRENKTLELFPIIKSGNYLSSIDDEDDGSSDRFVPNQFFEFLPTKN